MALIRRVIAPGNPEQAVLPNRQHPRRQPGCVDVGDPGVHQGPVEEEPIAVELAAEQIALSHFKEGGIHAVVLPVEQDAFDPQVAEVVLVDVVGVGGGQGLHKLRVQAEDLLHPEEDVVVGLLPQNRDRRQAAAVALRIHDGAEGLLPPQTQDALKGLAVSAAEAVDPHGLHRRLALQPVQLRTVQGPLLDAVAGAH